MTTKELIKSEIDHLPEDDLDELYQVIQEFAQSKQYPAVPSLMSKLKQVKIDAPADFAANLDLYVNGDKGAS